MTSLGLTIPLSIATLIGLILNAYILIVVVLTRQAQTANNILLLHLGTLNTVLGLLFLAFSAPGLTRSNWLSYGAPCAIHGFLFTLLHPLVLWTICGLNCDRYYAIAAPLHYGHLVNRKKVFVGLGAGWAVSLALSLPPFFAVGPFTFNNGLGACAPDFSLGPGVLWYSALYTAFTLLLPATLIICCNLKILMIARYHRHRIASAIYEVTLSAQVTITHQRNPFFVPTVTAPSAGGPKFRGKSAISTVLQLVGSFLLVYVPYYSIILWEAATGTLKNSTTSIKIDQRVLIFASVMLICSPSINGFFYGVKNKTLRKTFQNYWRKKLTKSEVNQEIQARTPSTCGSRRPSLTPLGFFSKPVLTRRLSEAFLDVHKVMGSPTKSKMKRISSELTWRPNSTPGLNLSPSEEDCRKNITHTASCNTLQVPRSEIEEVCMIVDEEVLRITKRRSVDRISRPSRSNANLFLQRVFRIDQDRSSKKATVIKTVLESTPKRSPRILITRAFSEESDKTSSVSPSPAKEALNKKLSSSTTIIERKWRQLRYQEEDSDNESCHVTTTRPLLSSAERDSTTSNRSSESSDTSDLSTGKIYMALDSNHVTGDVDNDGEGHEAEDQLLLSWPNHKKYDNGGDTTLKTKSSLLKQSLVTKGQCEEIVL